MKFFSRQFDIGIKDDMTFTSEENGIRAIAGTINSIFRENNKGKLKKAYNSQFIKCWEYFGFHIAQRCKSMSQLEKLRLIQDITLDLLRDKERGVKTNLVNTPSRLFWLEPAANLLDGTIRKIYWYAQKKHGPHSRSKCNSGNLTWRFVAQAFPGSVVNP